MNVLHPDSPQWMFWQKKHSPSRNMRPWIQEATTGLNYVRKTPSSDIMLLEQEVFWTTSSKPIKTSKVPGVDVKGSEALGRCLSKLQAWLHFGFKHLLNLHAKHGHFLIFTLLTSRLVSRDAVLLTLAVTSVFLSYCCLPFCPLLTSVPWH